MPSLVLVKGGQAHTNTLTNHHKRTIRHADSAFHVNLLSKSYILANGSDCCVVKIAVSLP